MTPEQQAAQSLAERALRTKRPGEALILIQAAQSLDPSINAEELKTQWLNQWLEANKNRNGEPSQ